MSLTLIHSQEAKRLHTTCFVPVFRDGYNWPDFKKTLRYIKDCIINADIDNYGIYDTDNGFTVALPGANALIRFMYFFEGDRKQESELRFTPETEEQIENMVEWLSELTSDLGLKEDAQLYMEESTLVLRFATREANVKTHFQIMCEFQDEQKLVAQSTRDTPSPV